MLSRLALLACGLVFAFSVLQVIDPERVDQTPRLILNAIAIVLLVGSFVQLQRSKKGRRRT